jgi:hypothetical protein
MRKNAKKVPENAQLSPVLIRAVCKRMSVFT